MPEHKANEPSQNAQEQSGGKQQSGVESNTQSDNKIAPSQKNQKAAAPDKNDQAEDERTGEATGARAGEYS
ncbi:MAG: hypothetical protein ACR2LC_07715 [Pyrinomonadaceae bacterium]